MVIIDSRIQAANALLHARHVYLLIHLKHLFEELQVNVFQLHEVAVFMYYAEPAQELQTLVFLCCQLFRQIIAERQSLTVLKKRIKQLALSVKSANQLFE